MTTEIKFKSLNDISMEPRRVELTAVKSPIASEKKQRPKETLRFTLSLKESTDKAFSEFSFAELKRNVQVGFLTFCGVYVN